MEIQAHAEMSQGDTQEQRSKEMVDNITEEQFLKDLYLFMRKRDTPIERIPHLGFKQIDLFVMFKTVRDLGGYHQVTAQQLWKQVYNRLGGNPRSTSAATCTRRHYEKLLLPYECHKKGIMMKILPQHQPKFFHEAGSSQDSNSSPKGVKRKLLTGQLHPNTPQLQTDPHGKVFPVGLHYPPYFHPGPIPLSQYTPHSSSVLVSQRPPSPEPPFVSLPHHLIPTDRMKEPLEHLRHLAEQYKNSSGLAEPLNLSVKAPRYEINVNPTSSFAPPVSSKNPKFLNKPSPLYTALHPQVLRNENESETHEAEADITANPILVKEGGAYVINVKAVTATSSPTPDCPATVSVNAVTTAEAQKPRSPNPEFSMQAKEEGGTMEAAGLNLSHFLPGLPQNNKGKMEIEIPLSMLQMWLKLCGPSAVMNAANQPPCGLTPERLITQRASSDPDVLPTNLSRRIGLQHWGLSAPEDLRLRHKVEAISTPTTHTAAHNSTSQIHFNSYKALSSSSVLKNNVNQELFLLDRQDNVVSCNSKTTNCWNGYDKDNQASHSQVKSDFTPPRGQQDFPVFIENTHRDRLESNHSGMVRDPSSALLHLTPEEVMKLKKIISKSL